MENVILTSLSVNEVRQLFRDELKSFFPDSKVQPETAQKESESDQEFDINGLAHYLKCSKQTIHNLKKEGAIPYYRLGRKVYFKKSEIDVVARVDRFLERIIS